MCDSKRAARCLPRPANHIFSIKLLGFIDTEEVNTETRVCCTGFGIVTFIMNGYTETRFKTWSGNILSFLLPLIQEGQLSVTGESMCTKYWLTA